MAQPSLSCTLLDQPEQVTVTAAGELDLNTCATLRRAVEHALTLYRPITVLDLNAVTFISSEGISEVLWTRNRAATTGTRLRVLPSLHVRRILTVAGLVTLLNLSDIPEPAG
ncbi:STAS domain-containing protein [Micromonospora sp. CPCC 205371]|nr:STAS domain-containing protein [Micromonospora sp. CPCC 205371]